MNLAVVGCGYVAEFYGKTLGNYPQLRLVGAYDRDAQNLAVFRGRWPCRAYDSLDELLADPTVELVLNLTNPRDHYEITRRCLEAGKHVYSEKPLAMDAERARELVDLAMARGLMLSSAPCSLLSETAQTVGKALRDGAIGRVRLVYANFDDGMIAPQMSPWTWRNESGVAWPAKDEFEVGCTYEHAGYVLTWLAAFFGPALRMSAAAHTLIPEKGIPTGGMAPDFTVGCIEYGDGVVARVTCSLVAPLDRSLTIIGDEGELVVESVRNDAGPVILRTNKLTARERAVNALRRRLRWPGWREEWRSTRHYPLVGKPTGRFVSPGKPVDFCRGPAEMAEALVEGREPRLSAELGWHITEIVERLQYPERFTGRPELASSFAPIAPRVGA
jgi:predicted dehydrogenase